ncbi:hypothetical protein [Streptomyces sp. WMMB303]|uniref:hypothetical protein n=1 Tax=Streptomyces sp. WMMB303 TaxID=3034154 RepID=UPI0023ED1B35|nr:hypothetical protein [Streptomyces sp. WMMB303]MDF4254681.1 hypothetical protein [Streptomyces sp. WMMB303]
MPEPYRPQPFTPDLIPEPVEVEAEGALTPEEVDTLGHCEAAFANGTRAEWMKWKAAHVVRSRRLHRDGGRTWADYCQDQFGESESEVNRRIQQWPLLRAIAEQQDRPRSIPDSHVQQLLPMVEQHGRDITARAYVALRVWAAERRHRVTAGVVDGLVELARSAESPALTTANTFQQAIEAKPKRAKKASAEPREGALRTDSRPNSGDSAAPAGKADETVVDAEIVQDELPEDRRAGQMRDVLQELLAASEEGGLEDVPTGTLKEISAAALSIAQLADEVLQSR